MCSLDYWLTEWKESELNDFLYFQLTHPFYQYLQLRLKVEESKLEKIAEQQGTSVESFVGLLKENQTILDGLKKCVKGDAEQIFVSAILDSDWDESNTFSDKEIKMLGIRMQNVPGVTINQQNLEKRVKATDGSLSSILKLLSEMDDGTIPDEERIFVIDSSHLTAKK